MLVDLYLYTDIIYAMTLGQQHWKEFGKTELEACQVRFSAAFFSLSMWYIVWWKIIIKSVLKNLIWKFKVSEFLEFFSFLFQGFISNLTIQRQYFPNDEDQVGAAKALLRLQDTYNLDTDTISKGNLPGKNS